MGRAGDGGPAERRGDQCLLLRCFGFTTRGLTVNVAVVWATPSRWPFSFGLKGSFSLTR